MLKTGICLISSNLYQDLNARSLLNWPSFLKFEVRLNFELKSTHWQWSDRQFMNCIQSKMFPIAIWRISSFQISKKLEPFKLTCFQNWNFIENVSDHNFPRWKRRPLMNVIPNFQRWRQRPQMAGSGAGWRSLLASWETSSETASCTGDEPLLMLMMMILHFVKSINH